MINRKTKQIREANLILEKRYLNEQVTSTPPSATTTPSSTSTSPVVTTTTTVKKMSETKLKSLRDCSGFNSGKLTGGLTSGSTEDNYVIFNLNGKPFCKKQETK
jgi:hypothetical protein